ncbi:AMP-binding protein [Nocardioides sp. NPDC058538]|uniref:AMP-binding protein n=1 Tax=Nocardioides sp. NPDC058538 TaxID=3346542 RepID=UPI003652E8D4
MSLTRSLHRGVQQHPDRIYSIFRDRTHTYREMQDRVSRIAGGLKGLGLEPEGRVAILAVNSDTYLQVVLAIGWADGIVVPVNTRWTVAEIVDSLVEAEVSVLIVDDHFASAGTAIKAHVPSIAHLIHAGETANPDASASVSELAVNEAPIADAHRSGEQPMGIFYTGGTTGRSRGVVLSNRALTGAALGALATAPFEQEDACLVTAPLFHLAQFSAWFTGTQIGATQVITAAFDPVEVMRVIDKHQVRRAVLVPTMLHVLLTHPESANFELDSLRTIVYGGSSISQVTLAMARSRLPEVKFLQIYGMTEMAATVTALQPEDHADPELTTSAGRAGVHCEIKIVDPNTGHDVNDARVGEILVRGEGLMSEYWRRPSETAEVMRGGWLRTGDAGWIDDAGYLYVVDRVKDMIVSGGENVYSVEVENVVASHPAVSQCAIIGTPDEVWGERVHAVVVLHDGAHLDLAELDAHCRDRIAGYKCPRGLSVVEALPVSGVGKVLKRQLRGALA